MGIWSATSTVRRRGDAARALARDARAARRRAHPRSRSSSSRDDRDGVDRALLDGRDAVLGSGPLRNRPDVEHPLIFVLSIPATVISIGSLGFLLAVAFVRHRRRWALGNLLEYPVWLICGFLVPLRCSRLGAADLVGARADLGHATRSASRRSAATRCPTSRCASRLGAVYSRSASLVARPMLNAARARARSR